MLLSLIPSRNVKVSENIKMKDSIGIVVMSTDYRAIRAMTVGQLQRNDILSGNCETRTVNGLLFYSQSLCSPEWILQAGITTRLGGTKINEHFAFY